MDSSLQQILDTDKKRTQEINKTFNPITGQGSVGERVRLDITDFSLPIQYIPKDMMKIPLIRLLAKHKSISSLLINHFHVRPTQQEYTKVSRAIIRLRFRNDFPFWAASVVKIKNKGGGDDVLFRLNRPQRTLVDRLEQMRLASKPIRLILLKARQWGGSTLIQLYMAWLQFCHKTGLNSLIIAHQGAGSDEIKDMFDRMIQQYPTEFLHQLGEPFAQNEVKITSVGKSGSISRIPQRNCKIKIGTAERPDSCRGGDYNLVHLSEVGIWKKTDGKSPEDIVRSACSGILYKPYTMIVMESTANGTGNFFHREYEAAANPALKSQFQSLFIAWYDIDQYSLPFDSPQQKLQFASELLNNKDNNNVLSPRQETGRYLWWLWEKGATLEAINWYVHERAGKNDHALMASEYPSDDVEAFVHSGSMVFDRYMVKAFEAACRPPRFIGDVYADNISGLHALDNLTFKEDSQALLWIWSLPETDTDTIVSDRYLTVVDVGGRSNKSDFSVILVLDRMPMIDADKPIVVAQWYGHIDIDLLAWKAAQIAAFYDNSLLVIESNTIETHDKERHIEGGDQSQYILNQLSTIYPNLYARRQSEDEIRQGIPRKYGFHTNIATKPMIISTLIKVVREHLYTERDIRCLDELLCYERKQNGAYGAIAGKHDDLLMTRAIALHICFHELPVPHISPRLSSRIPKKDNPSTEAVF